MDRRQALIAALSVVGLGAAGCGSRNRSAEVVPTPSPPNRLYPSLAADLFHPGARHLLATGDMAVSKIVPGVPAGLRRAGAGRRHQPVPGPGAARRAVTDASAGRSGLRGCGHADTSAERTVQRLIRR